MSNKLFMIAQKVVDTFGMLKAYAYKLIQEMNQEMVKKVLTIQCQDFGLHKYEKFN